MDYLFERRRRRRRQNYYSPSSSRDEEEIEQEIIERYVNNSMKLKKIDLRFYRMNRAIEIERNRERSLRRQFEYIVHNVKVCFFAFIEKTH